jgi:PPOX class probable F420-dependent enzyme
MSPDDAREFVASNHRAVLISRRSSGGLQTSPVLVGVDDEGKVVISTREGAYKTRNLRRDPTVVLCVLSDDFFGRWIQIEGTAQIVSLPEAMEGLVDYRWRRQHMLASPGGGQNRLADRMMIRVSSWKHRQGHFGVPVSTREGRSWRIATHHRKGGHRRVL